MRYEVGISIEEGNIVWAHGPFECGTFSDLRIYRSRLKHDLLEGEMIVADQAYPDETYSGSQTTNGTANFAFVRARHEATNKRFKQFNVLGGCF